jgi:hypothetical protein
MTNSITPPPPELVGQWQDESPEMQIADHVQYLIARAAQWGADRELEACCEWLHDTCVEDPEDLVPELRAARRPKPPSLKEQAIEALDRLCVNHLQTTDHEKTIRRALEALDD